MARTTHFGAGKIELFLVWFSYLLSGILIDQGLCRQNCCWSRQNRRYLHFTIRNFVLTKNVIFEKVIRFSSRVSVVGAQ